MKQKFEKVRKKIHEKRKNNRDCYFYSYPTAE